MNVIIARARCSRQQNDKVEIFGDLHSKDKLIKIASEEIKEGDDIKE